MGTGGPAQQELATLSPAGGPGDAAAFMDAVVIVGPFQCQRHPGKPADPPALLRTLYFGQQLEGLVTFLVYPPDNLVLVVKI